jgi:hypothetical protein
MINAQLSVLPTFVPLTDYRTYVVNKFTDAPMLHYLIELAKQTKYFSVDTESDIFTNRPALIQIEFIHQAGSTVVLVEACHLPFNQQSLRFWLIRSLLKFILRPSNVIYSWGNAREELLRFLPYGLFSGGTVGELNVVDIQTKFKLWYDRSGRSKPDGRLRWGLQAAIAETFDEFLDKKQTLNVWSRGLYDPRRPPRSNSQVQSMINYAVNDCLAVTRLAYAIEELIVSSRTFLSSDLLACFSFSFVHDQKHACCLRTVFFIFFLLLSLFILFNDSYRLPVLRIFVFHSR